MKFDSKKNLTITIISFISLLVVTFCFVTFAWILFIDPTLDGMDIKIRESSFEYKYYFDDEEIKASNGKINLDIDWAIPGKLYKVKIEIIDKKYDESLNIYYRINLNNIVGMLYEYDSQTESYIYVNNEVDIFSYYKIILEKPTNQDYSVSSKFIDEFDYQEVKDILKNDLYESYFENDHLIASFYDIKNFVCEFKQTAEITSFEFFIYADDLIDVNRFQESIYEGRLIVTVIRKEN